MNNKREFTSRLTNRQAALAIAYLPVHLWLLPMLVTGLMKNGLISKAGANLLCYGVGLVFMAVFLGDFLIRDFSPVIRDTPRVLAEVVIGYGLMLLSNLLVNIALMFIVPVQQNPNNMAVFDMAGERFGAVAVLAVLMAPIVEECIFRAGIFGTVRRYNRVLAYAVTMLLFSAYHVWSYAIHDPINWVYMLQYIPITFILCRCYERTNSIWGSIFLHMLINGISVAAMNLINRLMDIQQLAELARAGREGASVLLRVWGLL